MKLLYLKLTNFGPFAGTHIIDFANKSSIVMVTAEYVGASGRSNRAGKSSILDAIVYLLYGECRVREVDFIHYGEPYMVVDGVFGYGSGGTLTIKRGRTTKNEPIFEVNGCTGSRLQEEIDRVLGISYKDFICTNYFQQLDMHKFMEAGAAEKQKLLSQWLGNDYWKKYEDTVKSELDMVISKMSAIAAELSVLENQKLDSKVEERMLQANSKISVINTELVSLNETRNELLSKKTSASSPDTATTSAASDMKYLDEKIKDIQIKLDNYERWRTDQEYKIRALEQLEQRYRVEDHNKAIELLNTATTQIQDTSTKIINLQIKIETLSSGCTGTCPLLGETCTRVSVEALSPQIEFLKKELSDLYAEKLRLEEISKAIVKVKEDGDRLVRDITLAKSSVESTKSVTEAYYKPDILLKDMEIRKEAYDKCKALVSGSVSSQSFLTEIIKSLSACEYSISSKTTEIDKLRSEVSVAQFQLDAERSRITRVKDLRTQLSTLNQQRSELYILQYVFSKNGVPLVQLENAFSQLESEINSILEFLHADCRVVFSSYKELTTKESECSACHTPFSSGDNACASCGSLRKRKRKEDMSIRLIYSNGVEADFSSDSGGGKALISLAVRPALSRILQRRQMNPCNLLLLDEVFANFDAYNRDMVMDSLEKLFVGKLGFEQVFMITHHDISSWGHRFDELKVIKDGLTSSVGWV